MNRNIIRRNIISISIVVFIVLYSLVVFIKPNFVYNHDGSLRNFGIGTKKNTIVPIWLIAIILAILSYFFVIYYLAFPRLKY